MATETDVDPAVRAALAYRLERAEFLLERGRESDFVVALRDLRELEPLGAASLVRGRWFARLELIEEAVVELEALLARGVVNAEPKLFVSAGVLLAEVLQQAERDDEANRILQRVLAAAIEHDLFDSALMCALGVAAGRRGDTDAALRLLDTGYAIAVDDTATARALSALGALHLAAGRRREALACTWRARGLHARLGDDAGTARDLCTLGDLAWAAGRRRVAMRAWRSAVERLPWRCSAKLAETLKERLGRGVEGSDSGFEES